MYIKAVAIILCVNGTVVIALVQFYLVLAAEKASRISVPSVLIITTVNDRAPFVIPIRQARDTIFVIHKCLQLHHKATLSADQNTTSLVFCVVVYNELQLQKTCILLQLNSYKNKSYTVFIISRRDYIISVLIMRMLRKNMLKKYYIV